MREEKLRDLTAPDDAAARRTEARWLRFHALRELFWTIEQLRADIDSYRGSIEYLLNVADEKTDLGNLSVYELIDSQDKNKENIDPEVRKFRLAQAQTVIICAQLEDEVDAVAKRFAELSA